MDDDAWRLPLIWREVDGRPAPEPSPERMPFLEVEFANRAPGSKWIRTLALVDTGATYSNVSNKALSLAGAPAVATQEVYGNWATKTVGVYEILLRATGAEPFELAARVTELQLSKKGFAPEIVLGMDFLRYGRLVIDQFEGQTYFELRRSTLQKALSTNPAQKTVGRRS